MLHPLAEGPAVFVVLLVLSDPLQLSFRKTVKPLGDLADVHLVVAVDREGGRLGVLLGVLGGYLGALLRFLGVFGSHLGALLRFLGGRLCALPRALGSDFGLLLRFLGGLLGFLRVPGYLLGLLSFGFLLGLLLSVLGGYLGSLLLFPGYLLGPVQQLRDGGYLDLSEIR